MERSQLTYRPVVVHRSRFPRLERTGMGVLGSLACTSTHYDKDNSQDNHRCIENGLEEFQHSGAQVIEDIEEFKARLILRRGKFQTVIRLGVDSGSYDNATNYENRFKAPNISRYLLSAVQTLKQYRDAEDFEIQRLRRRMSLSMKARATPRSSLECGKPSG